MAGNLGIGLNVLNEIRELKDIVRRRKSTDFDSSRQISYINEPISYEAFFLQYLIPNKPCMFGPWLTENWKSRQEWINVEGKPNTQFLSQKFGEATVPVANCNKEEFSSHPKQDFLLKDYLMYLENHTESDDGKEDFLYCKDWHFVRNFPEYRAYEVPVYFQSDWLNELWDTDDAGGDDYRFVYMGPKGTWTSLHADVLRSYSWSANVCGRKKWILFPPGEELYLRDKLGNLAFNLDSPEMKDKSKYPHVDKIKWKFEVIQEAGEVIFVPSGWHHQVYNLEDTISINHNWLNGCNVDISWQFVKSSLRDVQHEIQDCRSMEGWHEQCQLILKASSGINYEGFYRFLKTIAYHRLKSTCTARPCAEQVVPSSGISEDYSDPSKLLLDDFSLNLCIFDLQRIQDVIGDMLSEEAFTGLDMMEEGVTPGDLLNDLQKHLKKIRDS